MDLTEKKNYYEVLEVPIGASPQDIERAYTRARNAYSGDSVALYSLMSADDCAQILNQIEEAYSVLGFPEKRREYDRVRGFNVGMRSMTEEAPAPGLAPRPEPSFMDTPRRELPETHETPANFQYESYGSNLNEAKVSKVQALKKFSLDYTVNPAMEQRIEEATDFSGPFLKEIREYKNVSMERMVEMTRISRTHIDTIETDNVKKLPADAYLRGFVSQIAKVLKLNPDLVATSYIHHIKRLKGGK